MLPSLFTKKTKVYVTTKDPKLKPHIQKLNEMYSSTCDIVKVQPRPNTLDPHQFDLDPDIVLDYIDNAAIAIHTKPIQPATYSMILDCATTKNYKTLVELFGLEGAAYVTIHDDHVTLTQQYSAFKKHKNVSQVMIDVYQTYIQTRVYFLSFWIDNTIFPNHRATSFPIYDLRINNSINQLNVST